MARMKINDVRRKRWTKKHQNHSRLKRIAVIFTLILAISVSAAGLVLAEDRVGQGVKDIARGGVSVPAEIAKTTNESNIISGAVVGTTKGVYYTIDNVARGVFKILTFYVPNKE